ncbi:class I SAM-dependent methyltransferase [Actinoplanes sp. NEAU-A12]|uniref:Class I SAM-dependent methyltransferase n=1 Tax=Actinoplanes sandaracinus TaxID=3045177 RepID=A0ABT6WN25_9ACTN|nr:class I SAM-dependent methyltransferase [Actinoplanes sandaracinus]MDI6101101.1 class I SAM-dependent methyltransferase [Actinoplanes sandaracinus]
MALAQDPHAHAALPHSAASGQGGTTQSHAPDPRHGGYPDDGHVAAHAHSDGQERDHVHGDGHGHGHGDGLQEMLDLDAEVAAGPLAELIGRIAELSGNPVRDVLDLGAGTGSGAFALLRHFPEARVTAIDTSEEMLRHLGESARRHGLADRVRPRQADLDTGWPETGPADLIWASSSMHHMTDPDQVLRDIRATLRPGGLLTMIEMESMPRFLPDDLGIGRPGLEARCHTLMEQARNEHLPHMGSDWAARLTAVGFRIIESRDLTVDLPAPPTDTAVRYAYATLRRFRAGLTDRLSPDDQTTLDALLTDDGPNSLRTRPDLAVHSTRSVWIATPS